MSLIDVIMVFLFSLFFWALKSIAIPPSQYNPSCIRPSKSNSLSLSLFKSKKKKKKKNT